MSTSGVAVAAFSGEIDFTARETFRTKLHALAEAETVIVDLSDVSYMDSTALAEILRLQRLRAGAARSAPRLVLGKKIARLFEVAGLRSVLPSFTTLDEAATTP